jgi:hypothetical protein
MHIRHPDGHVFRISKGSESRKYAEDADIESNFPRSPFFESDRLLNPTEFPP